MNATLTELFSADLRGELRRMGNRDLGAGVSAPLDEAETDARQAVWQTLCDAGGLRPGLIDQVELAELIGAALYQSPWADTVLAAEIAAAAGRDDLAARMTGGEAVAVAVRGRARDEPDRPGDVTIAGGRLGAVRQFVAFAPDATWFLLVGPHDLYLVPGDHPGVDWRRHDDIGRGDFYQVTFRDIPLDDVTSLPGDWPAALVPARIRHAAQLVGAAQAALDETTAYLRERRQFGQSIGEFQAPAFRMADLATRIHATRLLVRHAAGNPDQDKNALATAADLIRTAAAEAIQLHGAVGMTEEHDAQLFYRRAAVDALLWGRPTELRRQAATRLKAAYAVR